MTARTAAPAAGRWGSLGSVIPISLVEPDGLIITTDGRYVRVLECERVPNPISADQTQLQLLERAYRELCRAIPDGQALSIYSQTDTIADVREALTEDRDRVQAACEHDLAHGHPDLALARRRLLAGLTQTVVRAAGAEQPGVAARWWVAVPYRPRASAPRDELRQAGARARGRTTWSAHHHAAVQSDVLATQIQAALAGAGIDAYRLDGVSALAILWERLHPAATILPHFKGLAAATHVAAALSPPAGCATTRYARCVIPPGPTRPPRAWTPATPAASPTPTGRWRRSCTSAPRLCRPARGGCPICWPALCRRRSRFTSPSERAPVSRRASGGAGSGCGPR